MLEDRGLATVAIAAVRAQAENTRPPRALWTSSQLGRPLGEPGDPAFQRKIILAALGLLTRTDGPVILAEFHEDPAGWTDNPAWQAPLVRMPAAMPDTPSGWAEAFAAELSALMPAWQRARARFGRTTTGLSFLAPSAWPGFVAACLAGDLPVAEGHATTALSLRFLCDDVKAFYGEAGQADGSPPSSRQVDTWFWRQTVGGALLQALRAAGMGSENTALKTVAGRFFVPTPWVVG
jgi:hypothetical protein